MFYKWGVVISYQFLHLTIIQGYSKLSLLDKGFPKGGGGGPTFGKNSQIMSFFDSVPKLSNSESVGSSAWDGKTSEFQTYFVQTMLFVTLGLS